MELGNLRKYEVRRTLYNEPETGEVRNTKESKGGTLDKMPDSRKRDLIEPTSSRKTWHQMRGNIPQSDP